MVLLFFEAYRHEHHGDQHGNANGKQCSFHRVEIQSQRAGILEGQSSCRADYTPVHAGSVYRLGNQKRFLAPYAAQRGRHESVMKMSEIAILLWCTVQESNLQPSD
jgi:hypothetical protein